MKKSLLLSTIAVVLFLLPFQNVYAYNTDSVGIKSWKETMDSCEYYEKAFDYQTALNWALQAEAKAKEQFGELDTNYVATIGTISEIWYYLGNLDSAIFYGDVFLKLCRKIFKGDHPDLAMSINNMAIFNKDMGNYKDAESLYQEALEMTRRIFKGDHSDIANSINNIADLYEGMGNYKDAEPLYKEALEMRRRIFTGDHLDLARSIGKMAIFYENIGNYKDAEPLYIEALEMSRRLLKGDHPNLATSINNTAVFYDGRGNYIDAMQLYNEALEMRRRIFKGDHPAIANSINSIAVSYLNRGNYKDAEPLLKEALEMYRRINKGDHPDLESFINNMAMYYCIIGNYSDAEPLFKEALEMSRRIYKGDHQSLAITINNYAGFYFNRGIYKEAEPLLKEALEMSRRIFKGDHQNLASTISNIAVFYDTRGNYKDAEPLFKEAIEMDRRIFKEDHPRLANSINNMAMFYFRMRNYTDAEPLFKEALEMRRRIFKGDHFELATSINNIANFFDERGNYNDAELLYKEALEMYKRIFKKDHPDLAKSINNIASFYESRGNYKDAEPLFKEALEMYRRIFKGSHPNLAWCINQVAGLYYYLGDMSKAEQLYIEALDMYKDVFIKQSVNLSESEREKFWNSMKWNFEKFLTFVKQRMGEKPGILSYTYDNILFTKALQFNSAGKIKKRILESGDSSLIEKFKNFTSKKEILVKLYSLPAKEVQKLGYNIDSLETIANNLEKELSLKSEEFKQSYEKKKVTWKLIQGLLKPDEAAIEVVRFHYNNKCSCSDSSSYAFLIVSDQTEEHPELVFIENGFSLDKEYYNHYRNMTKLHKKDNESFSRYWGLLYEKLKGFKKIYFSADGIYNKLNPSTLLMPDGRYLIEVQDIQQLNSTRDLLLGYYQTKQESNVYNSAVLIGNPNFSLSVNNLKETDKRARGKSENIVKEEKPGSQNLKNLPGTEKEIKEIEKYLKSKNWIVSSFLGDKALKSAVKSVNSPRVLHIATHGCFLADVDLQEKETMGMKTIKVVENPLLRSGLFFSGADNYFRTDSTKQIGEENSLLTAYEAMNLNLDKTELVVLSACETGLGEIKNGEGVYGLQRAFIQAGAESVIMSLWSVSDEATQELMSIFYKEWLGGKTKREAFRSAQLKLKEKYSFPYFWGAFVMVGE